MFFSFSLERGFPSSLVQIVCWSLKELSKDTGSILIKNRFNSWFFSNINCKIWLNSSVLWITPQFQMKVLIAKEFQRSASPFWDVSDSRIFQKQITILSLSISISSNTVLCGYDLMSLKMTLVIGNCINPCKILTAFPPSFPIHFLDFTKQHQRGLSQIQHIPTSWGLSAWGEVIFLILSCPWGIWPVNANFLY